jgi:hypothetical protein
VTLGSLAIDQRVFALVSIASALCGVLGSLFFAYDLLGRPGGPLYWILRLVVPALLGGILVGALFILLFLFERTLTLPDYQRAVRDVVILGTLLGMYYGLFVDPPDAPYKRRFPFSVRDALVGLVTATGFTGLFLLVNRSTAEIPLRIAAGGVAGRVLAGVWRAANHQRVAADARPRLVSRAGTFIGLIAGYFLVLAMELAITVPSHGVTLAVMSSVVVLAFVVGTPAGAVTGALTPYVFWRVNSLGSKGMQVLGLGFIFLAFFMQILEPLAQLVPS